jgi:hypothetical protein
VQRIQVFLYTYRNSYNRFIDLCSAINSLCIIEEKLSKEEAKLMSIDTKTLVTGVVFLFFSSWKKFLKRVLEGVKDGFL